MKETKNPHSVLLAQNLERTFTSGPQVVRAVHNVNLELKGGDLLAIMGRSGSGKTTLLNLLGGLDKPTSGEIFLQGRELTSLSERDLVSLRRAHIGYVLQSFSLLPLLSVVENVELPLHIQGVPYQERRKRAMEALELVGLTHRMGHRPYELSGGEQQRLAVARAIANRPKLLLADEPTAELDLANAIMVFTLLKDLARSQGMTVVVATHDVVVEDLGYRIQEMVDGTFVDHPGHPVAEGPRGG